MNQRVKISLFLIGLSVAMVSCLKPESFPPEPVIEFKDFQRAGDSAYLYVNFTDGDGDVGLTENETQPPYDLSSRYYYNLFIAYYEMVDGVWQAGQTIPEGNPIEFKYRVPVLTPRGRNKALKGEIRVMLSPYFYNPTSPHSDTIKYEIQLVDKALHPSNVVETPMIVR